MSLEENSKIDIGISQTQLSYLSQPKSFMRIENEKIKNSFLSYYNNYLEENSYVEKSILSCSFSSIISRSNNQLNPNIINIFNNSCPDSIKKEKEEVNLNKNKINIEKLNKKYENLQENYNKLILENQEIKNKLNLLENKVNECLIANKKILYNSLLNPEEEKILNEDLEKVKENENNKKKLISLLSLKVKETMKDNINKKVQNESQNNNIKNELEENK